MTLIKRLIAAFRMPTAHELLVRQLEDAKRDKTLASMQREAYQAHEKMLRDRILRIEAELASKEVSE